MKFDFDRVIDRSGSMSLKYDFAKERGKKEGLISMWVADMDFETVPEVKEALHKLADHGIFGYTETKEEYFNAVANWFKTRYDWEVKPSWLIKTPGVVFALAAAVRAFTKENEAVLIQQPVYYPFSEVVTDNGRRLVSSSLKPVNGHYEIDFEDFERKIVNEQVKLFLLCNPHNPVGRVWKEWELRKLGELCVKHGVIVVSDEIHADFVWGTNRHLVFADLDPGFEQISVTCTSPGKTFNLASLQVSNIFIPNEDLKKRFKKAVDAAGYSQLNGPGLFAAIAAYTYGEEWLAQLREYLEGNIAFMREYLRTEIPQIHLIEPEGTYLLWVYFRDLDLSETELEDLIVSRAGLWLDSGAMFGRDGEGFERFNIATRRETLKDALERLKNAVYSL